MSTQVTYAVLDSPIDPFLAMVADGELVALSFGGARSLRASKAWYTRQVPGATFTEAAPGARAMAPVRAWLRDYFAGRGLEGAQLPHRFHGTEFQQAVWNALFEVPAGETRTYGEIARRVKHPDGARAVGAAVGQNPIPIVAPCHRIVGANGSLTGFGGGLPRKRWLLAHEAKWADAAATASGRARPGRQLSLLGT
jgi:methylated-DNA-[protein]-cysteine S-methyltransferase